MRRVIKKKVIIETTYYTEERKKKSAKYGWPTTKDGKRDYRYHEKCYLKADGTPDYRRF